MADYYLEDKTRLKEKPKRTLGDYVEQNGIFVPKRFNSLDEARASGLPIIVRSEHQQDYDGVSGMLESLTLDRFPEEITDEQSLKEYLFTRKVYDGGCLNISEGSIKDYCTLLNLNVVNVMKEVSFSFWEHLRGFNRTIMADSAISNRYHIMTSNHDKPRIYNYTIFEGGKIDREFIMDLPSILKDGLLELTTSYEKVRNLPNFDNNHCPIMEFQTTSDGKNFFLQYHRARDFEPSRFKLERSLIDGEIEIPFVRGATSPKGEVYRATTYYHGHMTHKEWTLQDENCSFDMHYRKMFTELMVRQRGLQLIPMSADNKPYFTLLGFVVEHKNRSQLFKPKVSMIINLELLKKYPEEISDWYEQVKATGQNHSLNIYAISDGRRALIRRVD